MEVTADLLGEEVATETIPYANIGIVHLPEGVRVQSSSRARCAHDHVCTVSNSVDGATKFKGCWRRAYRGVIDEALAISSSASAIL